MIKKEVLSSLNKINSLDGNFMTVNVQHVMTIIVGGEWKMNITNEQIDCRINNVNRVDYKHEKK